MSLATFFLARQLLRTILRLPDRERKPVRFRVVLGFVALSVLSAGIALRWMLPSEIPPGLWIDWLFGTRAILYQPRGLPWIGGVPFGFGDHSLVSYFYLHYCDALFRVFGRGDTGFLALSALAGSLMLPAIAWLAAEVAGWRCAIGALGLAAFAQWPLILSRWGWCGTLLVTLLIFSAAATLAALRTNRLLYAVLAGLAAGFSMHTHPAAAAPLAGLGLFAVRSLGGPRRRALVCAAALAALLAFAPLGLGFLRNPQNLGGRPRDVSLYWAAARTKGTFQKARVLTVALMSNTVLYTGIPLWTSDPNPRHAMPGRAPLPSILGVAALVGLAVSLRRARCGTDTHQLLLYLGLGSMFAGILSYPAGAPNTFRACGVLGPLLVWSALGLDKGIEWLEGRLPVRAAFLWALALAFVFAVETPIVLNQWPDDPRVKAAFYYPETAAGRLRRELTDRETILDRAAIRSPLVVEALSGGRDPSKPIPEIPYQAINEILSHQPSEAFWVITNSQGLEILTRSGWRCARGVPLTTEADCALIALVHPI